MALQTFPFGDRLQLNCNKYLQYIDSFPWQIFTKCSCQTATVGYPLCPPSTGRIQPFFPVRLQEALGLRMGDGGLRGSTHVLGLAGASLGLLAGGRGLGCMSWWELSGTQQQGACAGALGGLTDMNLLISGSFLPLVPSSSPPTHLYLQLFSTKLL